ncbi:MAG: choice-of-anchor J domain-containing protein, partial [candidate division WOR-3 bacterium]
MFKKIMLFISCIIIGMLYAEMVPISKTGEFASIPNHKPETNMLMPSNRTILLQESFTGTTFPPPGWTRIQVNTGTQGGYPCYWDRFTGPTGPPPFYHTEPACAGLWWSYYDQDEWLITPPITLTGSSGGVYYLKWWTYGYRGSTYGDHYYTKIIVGNDTTVLYDLSVQSGGWNYNETPIEISLNAYAGQTVKIAWHADDPPPPNGPGLWYAWGIDDVEIGYPADNDVGVEEILSPGAFHTPNTIMTPQASVKNYGSANQTNFQVVCSIVGPGGVLRYYSSKTVASLAAGATTTVVFDTWRPTVQEELNVMMKTMLVGDQDPTNDRKTRTCLVSNISQIIIGTATTNQRTEPLDRFYNYNTHEVIYLQSEIGVACNILSLAYQKASGSNLDPITPVEIYMCHTTETSLPTGSVTLPPPPPYELVYSGPFPNDVTSGWLEVNLTTPFYYNNAEN